MLYSATWIQRENLTLREISQKEKDKHHMIPLICRILSMEQMNLFTKQKQTHRHRGQTYGCQRGGARGGMDEEFGVGRFNNYI